MILLQIYNLDSCLKNSIASMVQTQKSCMNKRMSYWVLAFMHNSKAFLHQTFHTPHPMLPQTTQMPTC
jgi:hypothetical protein